MPNYSFYFDAKEDKKDHFISLTEEEQKARREDHEIIQSFKDYQEPYKDRWIKSGGLYNVIQNGNITDAISNWYIGWSRIIISQGVAMMTEGEPSFEFSPVGPSDYKMSILWNSLVKHLLNKCNFQSHLHKFITDLHVFGSSPLEVYVETPQRLRRFGPTKEKIVRDFRRTKVGIRHRSIFRTLRNPNVTDYDDVPSAAIEEELTYNQFVQNYMNVYLPDGTPKFDCEGLPVASHVKVTKFFDEITDKYRIYALPFGTTVEGKDISPDSELGKCILNKSLSLYRLREQGRVISDGLNVPGMTPLAFGSFEDQLDADFTTHSVYGMGIPQLIEGPEEIMQALINMTIDNTRLKNTVLVSYEPLDGRTYMDVDMGAAYSGMMIDGKVTPQPLGVADVGSNQVLWEWLNELCIYITGINFKQLVGDDLKTYGQAAMRVRQNNLRALSRIKALENGPLKRIGTLLLASALSEVTVEEWDAITEDEAEEMGKQIAENEMTGEDYRPGDGVEPPKKRVHTYIPVTGAKLREDFKGKKKKRFMDSRSIQSTIVEDPSLPDGISYIPATPQYLLPSGTIESIMEFDTKVEGKHMLGDMKAQNIADSDSLINIGMTLKPAVPEIDLKKMFLTRAKVSGWDEKDVFMDEEKNKTEIETGLDKAITDIENIITQPTNAQSPDLAATMAQGEAATAPDAGQSVPQFQQQIGPPVAIQAAAAGTV